MRHHHPIVSPSWLKDNLHDPNLIIFEADLKSPLIKNATLKEREVIPGALYFDIETDFSDLKSALPHTMLNEVEFTKASQKLGVNQESIIVVYDKIGIYASPRVWWMFLAMGFENIYVLDGGFPAWKEMGFDTASDYSVANAEGNFKATSNSKLMVNAETVLKATADHNKVVIDARSADRFYGKAPEPREGLRKGHMPNAINIPFSSTLKDQKLLPANELEKVFNGIPKEKELIFSCGSGVTACIDALAATVAGYRNISIYDGSWSEWGLPSDLPVV